MAVLVIHEGSEAPPVHTLTRCCSLQQLRCHLFDCAAEGVCRSVAIEGCFTQPKVGQYYMSSVCILWLQISVYTWNLYKGHLGTQASVLSSEVVPYSEVRVKTIYALI